MLTITAATYLKTVRRRRLEGISELEDRVRPILEDVRRRGDEALAEYTARFDGPDCVPVRLEVTPEEKAAAWDRADPAVVEALMAAAERIRDFHSRQVQQSWTAVQPDGSVVGQLMRPVEAVGIYVPGGTAAYPSSVLMAAIPAQVAGVDQVIACTPPGPGGLANPYVVVAADIAGVDRCSRSAGARRSRRWRSERQLCRRWTRSWGRGTPTLRRRSGWYTVTATSTCWQGPASWRCWRTKVPIRGWWRRTCCRRRSTVRTRRPCSSPPARSWLTRCRGDSGAGSGVARRDIVLAALERHCLIVLAGSMEEAVAVANAYRGGAPGGADARSLGGAGAAEERRQRHGGAQLAGGGQRLRDGPESRAAHRRDGAELVGAVGEGLRAGTERDEPDGGGAGGRGGPGRDHRQGGGLARARGVGAGAAGRDGWDGWDGGDSMDGAVRAVGARSGAAAARGRCAVIDFSSSPGLSWRDETIRVQR